MSMDRRPRHGFVDVLQQLLEALTFAGAPWYRRNLGPEPAFLRFVYYDLDFQPNLPPLHALRDPLVSPVLIGRPDRTHNQSYRGQNLL